MPPPTTAPKKSRFAGCLPGCLFAFLLVTAVMGYYWWDAVKRDKQHDAEVAKLKEFDRFAGAKGPPANALDDAQARYRKGHLILIDAKDGKLDGVFLPSLPPALRATSPDDVGTEVWVTYDEHSVGKYDNGSEAYKSSYDVVVYDVARNAVVAREHIEGDEPPQTAEFRQNSTFAWRKIPGDKLVKFLQDLPAR